MAPQLGNYVLETATSPGTGSFVLNGAEADRRSFAAAFSSGGSVFYFADDGSQAEWGVGALTIGTPNTLARTKILGNTSNTTAALNFAGSVEVWNEIPANYLPIYEDDGRLLLLDVGDWTSGQAVNARSADGRYLKWAAYAGRQPGRVTVDSSGYISIEAIQSDGSSIWHVLADQEQISTINTAIAATNSTLNESIANLNGAISGETNARQNAGYVTGNAASGASPVKNIQVINQGSPSAYVQADIPGAGSLTLPSFDMTNAALANYAQPKGNYLIGTAANILIQVFTFQITQDNQRVAFPRGFSDKPLGISLTPTTKDLDLGAGDPSTWDPGGFTVTHFGGTLNQIITVVAAGLA